MSSSIPAPALTAPIKSAPPDWSAQAIPDCIAQLTALFALHRELLRHEAMWLVGVPYWDAKQAIAQHILTESQHIEAILKRLHELKAVSSEHKQVAGVEELVHALASAQHGDEWLHGLYNEVKPWLVRLVQDYLQNSDPIMDQPTHLVLVQLLADQQEHIAWFQDYTPQFSNWECEETRTWTDHVQTMLAATKLEQGILTTGLLPPPRTTDTPFQVFAQVRRDRTIQLTEKCQFPAEGDTFAETRFYIFYHHTQEMLFAESLCAVLYETAEMPWAFHYDLARHIADEVRHATMGQLRLEQLGIPLTDLPMFTFNYEFRSHIDPMERFCLMTLVMEASGFAVKRARAALLREHGDLVSALYEDYDIKDEMMHANLGHVWVPIMLRVYHDSRTVPQLTEHCRRLFE